jgi:signal transduction histidine kinase
MACHNQGGAGPPVQRGFTSRCTVGHLRIVATVGDESSAQASAADAQARPAMGQSALGQSAPGRPAAARRDTAGGISLAILLGPVSLRTWRAIVSLIVSLIIGGLFLVLLTAALLLAASVSWIVGLGTVVMSGTLRFAWWMARVDRWRIRRTASARVEPAPLPAVDAGLSFRQRQRAWAQSPVVWRLVAYQMVRPLVAAAALFLVAGAWFVMVTRLSNGGSGLLLGIIALFAWPLLARLGSVLDVSLARVLIGPSRSGQLSAEVRRLGEARSLAVESAETERRRIERDLHDGLQPKLVSLALELGLARARFERDPASARSLIDQAHEEAKTAIEDLRGLVRGIHPSVLDERGLDAAFSALVASCAVPVRVDVSLGKRPDQAVEAVAYFVVAEAITNVTKHSGATRASVVITESGGLLRVLVVDDGGGGAAVEPGGGLAGLAARVAAIDGTFRVTSPPGGPTHVEAVIPCAR